MGDAVLVRLEATPSLGDALLEAGGAREQRVTGRAIIPPENPMAKPFPGMDPWLEHPDLWRDVHNSLIAAIRDQVAPLVRPRYVVRLEERTYVADTSGLALVGSPDVAIASAAATPPPSGSAAPGRSGATTQVLEVSVPVPDVVRETWLEVRLAREGDVVTVVEILSPTNKLAGHGRVLYERKRATVLGSLTSLVEVDLLRSGEPMPVDGASSPSDYRILVSRGERRPRAALHVFSVRDPIPTFELPLRAGDTEPVVDIGALLDALYERAAYDLSIDSGAPPVPALGKADRDWADERVRSAGGR